MIKLLQADNFFKEEDIAILYNIAYNLPFVDKEYGKEIENFNLVVPGLDPVFSKLLAEKVVVDEENSGVFRKPTFGIHFESFETISDWIFVVALERTTFNLYHHLSGAKTALDGYHFNYQNFMEWDYHTNLILQPNEGVIFRPWLFHSLEEGLVQVYRLKGKVDG